jgi:hypothetical protein
VQFEWPATWCYLSVGQCFVGLAIEFYSLYKQRKQAAATAAAVNGCSKSARMLSVDPVANAQDTVAFGTPDTPGKASKKKE